MCDGDVALERVKNQRCDGQALRACAGDIGGADVAAAGSANILTPKNTHEQETERNRTEQIRDNNDDDDVDQAFSEAVPV